MTYTPAGVPAGSPNRSDRRYRRDSGSGRGDGPARSGRDGGWNRGGSGRDGSGRDGRPYGRRPFRGNDRRPGGGQHRDRRSFDPARRAAIEAFDPAGSAFSGLDVPDRVVKILGVDGIVEPTPVQAAVVPDALAGRDVLGRARTGSGKTLAFGLPILARLEGERSQPNHPRALIIVPTRELAGQVTQALEPLAETLRLRMVTVYGGAPYDRQIRRLDRGADIVVATPGRLGDLVEKGACNLDAVEVVTLDEADHLCDLGFFPVVDELLGQTPAGGQRLLLSATLDGDVDKLVRRHLNQPARHEIDPDAGSVTTMDHHVLVVGPHNKLDVTTELVRANPRSIVFTRTKGAATRLAEDLEDAGVPAVDLHGDLSQRVRERNLDRFRTGRAQVVVATDVAARGIHVDGVGMVVHFDPAGESKSYLHRSGRTARAGASGAVVTVATPGQARGLGELFRRAGVTAKSVDARSLEGPITPTALAEAPAMAQRESRPRPGGRGAGNGRDRSGFKGRRRDGGRPYRGRPRD
ncbi:DEAD/DEAH box helicase [Jiangella asiatica]|uniref:DEAD/DEAH box helicase n=1 Tax=Jiangella asiatica TaxID=2530372 RepID=A0A4R5CS01_9ACTN|nr:DEAD/DEAH box helicase [Jiangella asiatica]TDE01631.1 DEAD/DEAH box helicase [Jiangella asiatica]